MKIVQFKNGLYGIRRFSLLSGYNFLGKDITEDYWWGTIKEFIYQHATMTKEEVIDRWKRYPLKKVKVKFDYGKPVNLID